MSRVLRAAIVRIAEEEGECQRSAVGRMVRILASAWFQMRRDDTAKSTLQDTMKAGRRSHSGSAAAATGTARRRFSYLAEHQTSHEERTVEHFEKLHRSVAR